MHTHRSGRACTDNGIVTRYITGQITIQNNPVLPLDGVNLQTLLAFVPPGGFVTSVNPGIGITITGPATAPIVNNDGVLTVTPGTGLNNTGTLQNPILNNLGVLSATVGTGLTNSGTAQNPVFDVTGILNVTAGTGITFGGTPQNPVINNAGVLTVTPGTAISNTGTAQNPILNNTGVTSIIGSSTINASSPTGAVTLSGLYAGVTNKVTVTGPTVSLPVVVQVGPTNNYTGTGPADNMIIVGPVTVSGVVNRIAVLAAGDSTLNITGDPAYGLIFGSNVTYGCSSINSLVGGVDIVLTAGLGNSINESIVVGNDITVVPGGATRLFAMGRRIRADNLGTNANTFIISGGNTDIDAASSFYNGAFPGVVYVPLARANGVNIAGRGDIWIGGTTTGNTFFVDRCPRTSIAPTIGDHLTNKTYVDGLLRLFQRYNSSTAISNNDFMQPGTGLSANELAARALVAQNANLITLRVASDVAPGGVATRTFTVRINGVGTAMTATITGAATSATFTGSVAVTAGQYVTIQQTQVGGPAASRAYATILSSL